MHPRHTYGYGFRSRTQPLQAALQQFLSLLPTRIARMFCSCIHRQDGIGMAGNFHHYLGPGNFLAQTDRDCEQGALELLRGGFVPGPLPVLSQEQIARAVTNDDTARHALFLVRPGSKVNP